MLRAARADAARTHDATLPRRARSHACVRVREKWRDAHLAGERGGRDAVGRDSERCLDGAPGSETWQGA